MMSTHLGSVKLPVESLPQTLQNWNSFEASKGCVEISINSKEHFSEYTIVFSQCASTAAYTHFERTTKRRSLAVFEILWQKDGAAAKLIKIKTFLGGPGVEKNTNERYRIEKLELTLKAHPANWTGLSSEGNLPGGKSLIAFHPQKTFIAYSTFFGISVWDYITNESEDIYSKMSEHQSSHLKFSECGTFITLLDHRRLSGFSPINVISLEGRAIFERSRVDRTIMSTANGESPSEVQIATRKRKLLDRAHDAGGDDCVDIQLADRSKTMKMEPSSIRFSSKDNRKAVEWLSYDGNNNTIDFRRIDIEGERRRRSLCSIPKADKYINRTATMAGLSEGAGVGDNPSYINFVLQKTPQSSYTLNRPLCDLPIVVRRAQGTFKAQKSSLFQITELTESKGGSMWKLLQESHDIIAANTTKSLAFEEFKNSKKVAALTNQDTEFGHKQGNADDSEAESAGSPVSAKSFIPGGEVDKILDQTSFAWTRSDDQNEPAETPPLFRSYDCGIPGGYELVDASTMNDHARPKTYEEIVDYNKYAKNT
ncbi:hypothetical protein ABW20_dc0103574 [Dactylellina cionopaga]|nr:hypothetical protein ABW20_dc0103574 [Dactylellina cionopaga]